MYSTSETAFSLDSVATIDAIAGLWGLDRDHPERWSLKTFGPDLGLALENLAGAVFAPTRGLVRGPNGEIRVLAIDDPRGTPVMVCLADSRGPMLCTAIEDATKLLEQGPRPASVLVLDVLQSLLDVATGTWRERAFEPARRRTTSRPRVGAVPPAVAVAYEIAGPSA